MTKSRAHKQETTMATDTTKKFVASKGSGTLPKQAKPPPESDISKRVKAVAKAQKQGQKKKAAPTPVRHTRHRALGGLNANYRGSGTRRRQGTK
jgi:hypothetical protein